MPGRPSNNYTVARVRRDILANSDVGAIVAVARAVGRARDDFNRVAGVDANFRFFKSLSLNGFAARSDTPGVRHEPERPARPRSGGKTATSGCRRRS